MLLARRRRPIALVATLAWTIAAAPVRADEPPVPGAPGPRGAAAPAAPASLEEPYRPTPPPYEAPPNPYAWASLVAGGVLLATGIGFGVAAVVEQRNARDIDQRAGDDEDLSGAEQTSYEDAIATRDDLRVVSGIAGGAGLGLFLVAGILFARQDLRREREQGPPVSGDVAATPWLGPGVAGGAAKVSF